MLGRLNNVSCERRSYSDKPHSHIHPYAQLIVPISGNFFVAINTDACEDVGQKIIYVPPECRHSYYAKSNNQFFVFDIPVGNLPHNMAGVAGYYSPDARWQAIRALLFDEVGEEPVASGRLHDLFRYILRLIEPDNQPASIAFIHNNFHRNITLKELAAIEHYNLTYYCEWFQQRLGLSPMAYIRKIRLEQVRELLASTDYNIMQIAQQVGYQHHSTLTRFFRKQFGLSPAEYRAKSRIYAK